MEPFPNPNPEEQPPGAASHPDQEYPETDWRGEKPPKKKGCGRCFGLLGVLLLLVLLGFLILPFTPLAGRVKRALLEVAERMAPSPEVVTERVEVPVVQEVEVVKEVQVPAPPPEKPSSYVPYRKINVGELFSGIQIASEVDTVEGDTATKEREVEDAYQARFEIKVRVPKPSTTLGELSAASPKLSSVLPDLGAMLEGGKVSGFYHLLYENKVASLGDTSSRLERALSRHNFFDLETILELTHPETKRKVLLIQSDMDVVSDGTDGDRMPSMDDYITMSSNYQPFTSYGWPKTTRQPNPLLTAYEKELVEKKARFAVKGLSIEENRSLRYRIDYIERALPDMRSRSFLIAEKDPFVVVSLAMIGYTDTDPFAPTVGDYAVVIHDGRVFPAIIGDAGPRTKIGEASLRLAKEINEKAGVYSRPVSDLSVTYLFFPKSVQKPFRQPVLSDWWEQCGKLLEEIGGIGEGFELHQWVDEFHPAPEAGGESS